jgi:hypothetical protein
VNLADAVIVAEVVDIDVTVTLTLVPLLPAESTVEITTEGAVLYVPV